MRMSLSFQAGPQDRRAGALGRPEIRVASSETRGRALRVTGALAYGLPEPQNFCGGTRVRRGLDYVKSFLLAQGIEK